MTSLLVQSQFNFNFDEIQKILRLIHDHKTFFDYSVIKLDLYKDLVDHFFQDIFLDIRCKTYNVEFTYDIDENCIDINSLYNGEYWSIGYISKTCFNFSNISVVELNNVVNAINNNFDDFELHSKIYLQICNIFKSVE